MSDMTLRGAVRGAEIIGIYDDPQVLVRIGDAWPGDEAIRAAADKVWLDEVGEGPDDLPEWHLECRRFRWNIAPPEGEYVRWLEPVDALERGTFWGVLCTPQPRGVPR